MCFIVARLDSASAEILHFAFYHKWRGLSLSVLSYSTLYLKGQKGCGFRSGVTVLQYMRSPLSLTQSRDLGHYRHAFHNRYSKYTLMELRLLLEREEGNEGDVEYMEILGYAGKY